jgi:hypothetical protein
LQLALQIAAMQINNNNNNNNKPEAAGQVLTTGTLHAHDLISMKSWRDSQHLQMDLSSTAHHHHRCHHRCCHHPDHEKS